ncbi:dgat2l1-prov protein [Cardiosporidium cionae]|uniref:Acyltransferase n=1 Tax=Cardiosporidium cionae TaxID=476202 RepID=A0ABQ7JCG7_9APIC|nr:dgat2l1-prov protein [Cardiosporidium cionae]|eukprot:KAF8821643.1 dgat2l1-prov protein [Cardiosporidium cionae]
MWLLPSTFLFFSIISIFTYNVVAWILLKTRWDPLDWDSTTRWQENCAAFLFCHLLPACVWLNLACVLCLKHVWWFYLPYCAFCLLSDNEHKGGLPMQWWRNSRFAEYIAGYYSSKIVLHNEANTFSSEKNYLIGYHPHGVAAVGCLTNFALHSRDFKNLFSGIRIRVATLNFNLRIPFLRHVLLFMGCISCNASSIKASLNDLSRGGNSAVVVVVGGAREAHHANNCAKIILSKRTGFFKLGLQTGADLVPVFCFGESMLYRIERPKSMFLLDAVSVFTKKRFGFVIPCFFGRGFFQSRFGWLTHKTPLNLVLGDPIHCPKLADPSDEDIDNVKQEYCRVLEEMFHRHKQVLCNSSGELSLEIL